MYVRSSGRLLHRDGQVIRAPESLKRCNLASRILASRILYGLSASSSSPYTRRVAPRNPFNVTSFVFHLSRRVHFSPEQGNGTRERVKGCMRVQTQALHPCPGNVHAVIITSLQPWPCISSITHQCDLGSL